MAAMCFLGRVLLKNFLSDVWAGILDFENPR